jgi:hypothetical protein
MWPMRRPLISLPLAVALLLGIASVAEAADAPNSCSSGMAISPNTTWLTETIGSGSDVDWYRFSLGSPKYVFVTLGHLPANYRLDLYSACGTLLASSSRSGKTYEEIGRSLGAQSYFVKVSGVSGAFSTTAYKLRFRPLSGGVVILSSTSWIDSGFLYIKGEVFNNTAGSRDFVEIGATLYNSSGTVVDTDFTYADMDIMQKKTRSPFDLIVYPVPGGYDHYKLSVSSSATTDTPVANLAIAPGIPFTDGISYRHYPGEVTNHNGFSVTYTEVVLTLYNDLGNLLNTEYTFTNPSTIGAGNTAPYEVLVADHYAATNRYVTQVQATKP